MFFLVCRILTVIFVLAALIAMRPPVMFGTIAGRLYLAYFMLSLVQIAGNRGKSYIYLLSLVLTAAGMIMIFEYHMRWVALALEAAGLGVLIWIEASYIREERQKMADDLFWSGALAAPRSRRKKWWLK